MAKGAEAENVSIKSLQNEAESTKQHGLSTIDFSQDVGLNRLLRVCKSHSDSTPRYERGRLLDNTRGPQPCSQQT